MKTKESKVEELKFALMNMSPEFTAVSRILQRTQKITIRLTAAVFLLACFCLPAFGLPTLDLTTAGSSGYIGDAYFLQVDPQPTGSGFIKPFVRLSSNQEVVQGYNTDSRPLEFDENNSPVFTRSLLLNDAPGDSYWTSIKRKPIACCHWMPLRSIWQMRETLLDIPHNSAQRFTISMQVVITG